MGVVPGCTGPPNCQLPAGGEVLWVETGPRAVVPCKWWQPIAGEMLVRSGWSRGQQQLLLAKRCGAATEKLCCWLGWPRHTGKEQRTETPAHRLLLRHGHSGPAGAARAAAGLWPRVASVAARSKGGHGWLVVVVVVGQLGSSGLRGEVSATLCGVCRARQPAGGVFRAGVAGGGIAACSLRQKA